VTLRPKTSCATFSMPFNKLTPPVKNTPAPRR
jgi:hypothetical protein